MFKVSAFGAVCVLGTKTKCFFSKLQPCEQDRFDLCHFFFSFIFFHIFCKLLSLFRDVKGLCNGPMQGYTNHIRRRKAVKEVKSTKQKLAQVVQRSEEKSQIAIERVKVRYFFSCLVSSPLSPL